MSIPPNQDIPAAQRQSAIATPAAPPAEGQKQKRQGVGKVVGLLCLMAAAGLIVWQWELVSQRVSAQSERVKSAIAPTDPQQNDPQNAPSLAANQSAASQSDLPSLPARSPLSSNSVATSTPTQLSQPSQPKQLLHHRRYEEVNPAELVALNPNSDIKLQPPVQVAVNEMIVKAKSEGVQLGIASGFRSIADQNKLFFEVKAERKEDSKTRAEVSAPPGYSEHHTGYAVDFIDESRAGTHTNASFETTPAYRWLKQNAPAYNFEMSFPKEPNSPVAYEPWHWRYVGDQKSLELFYRDQADLDQFAPAPSSRNP